MGLETTDQFESITGHLASVLLSDSVGYFEATATDRSAATAWAVARDFAIRDREAGYDDDTEARTDDGIQGAA